MTTPMSVYARIAERYGVDSRDDEAVDEFFLAIAPRLPEAERQQILDELLGSAAISGEWTFDVAGQRLKSRLRLLSLDDAPPVSVPGDAYSPTAPQGTADSSTSGKRWYIVHTYSGYEERVKETLEQRIAALGMRERFGEIRIPTEMLVETKAGKKRQIERKFFPGYILVEMEMSDAAWHLVKNTPKVTGFAGSGTAPMPLSEEELHEILTQVATTKEKPKPKHVYTHGEQVRIIDGPFTNFSGVVDEVNAERNTLRVMVSIFGRSTPVELDFLQVMPDDAVEESDGAKKWAG